MRPFYLMDPREMLKGGRSCCGKFSKGHLVCCDAIVLRSDLFFEDSSPNTYVIYPGIFSKLLPFCIELNKKRKNH
jgi:hypothetical protein